MIHVPIDKLPHLFLCIDLYVPILAYTCGSRWCILCSLLFVFFLFKELNRLASTWLD